MSNPHAVALGRLGGQKGGPARAAALSFAKLSSIGRAGARARWGLPEIFRDLFWQYDFDKLRLAGNEELVFMTVLSYGSEIQVDRLVELVGQDGIKAWVVERKGRGLMDAQITRFIPAATRKRWRKDDPLSRLWEDRLNPKHAHTW